MPNGIVVLNEFTLQNHEITYFVGIVLMVMGLISFAFGFFDNKNSTILLGSLVCVFCIVLGEFSMKQGIESLRGYEIYFTENVDMTDLLRNYKIIKIDGATAYIVEKREVREYEVE